LYRRGIYFRFNPDAGGDLDFDDYTKEAGLQGVLQNYMGQFRVQEDLSACAVQVDPISALRANLIGSQMMAIRQAAQPPAQRALPEPRASFASQFGKQFQSGDNSKWEYRDMESQ
jgi:hypothetical protein